MIQKTERAYQIKRKGYVVRKIGTKNYWFDEDKCIDEAYRRFEVVRPYINKELHKAFAPAELNEGAIRRCIRSSEE